MGFNRAYSIATRNPEKWKFGAVIISKNKIIATGFNRFVNGKSIHAEIDCLRKLKMRTINAYMIVIRINKSGELRNAKPCKACLDAIEKAGIKTVYHSI